MKSAALACLLVCLFTTESAVAQWKAFGSVSTTSKRNFKAEIVYVNNFKLFNLDEFNIYINKIDQMLLKNRLETSITIL